MAVSSRSRLLGVGVAVLVAVVVVVVVLVVARGGGSSGSAEVHVDAGAGAPRVGQVPPQFSGDTIDGSHFSLPASRGHVLLVNFFATWCENCRAELPLLQRTWTANHAQGLDIVTVDYSDTGDARAFLRSSGVTFPALLDPSSAVGHAYLVSDLPVTFFVGRDGRLVQAFHGQLSDATLSAALRGLL